MPAGGEGCDHLGTALAPLTTASCLCTVSNCSNVYSPPDTSCVPALTGASTSACCAEQDLPPAIPDQSPVKVFPGKAFKGWQLGGLEASHAQATPSPCEAASMGTRRVEMVACPHHRCAACFFQPTALEQLHPMAQHTQSCLTQPVISDRQTFFQTFNVQRMSTQEVGSLGGLMGP